MNASAVHSPLRGAPATDTLHRAGRADLRMRSAFASGHDHPSARPRLQPPRPTLVLAHVFAISAQVCVANMCVDKTSLAEIPQTTYGCSTPAPLQHREPIMLRPAAFCLLAAVVVSTNMRPAAGQVHFTVQNIGTLSGFQSTVQEARCSRIINNTGQVVAACMRWPLAFFRSLLDA